MKKRKIDTSKVIICTILVLFCLLILYPLIYILSVSVSSKLAVMQGKVWLYPIGFNLDAYKYVIQYDNFLNSYWNSIKMTCLGTGMSLIVNCVVAYPLSRMHLKGRKFFNLYFVITMVFNSGLMATYMNIVNLGLYDTIWAVLLPSTAGAYNLILMRTFFEQIPASLEEAALIDGAGDWTIFTKLTLPLSGPIISTEILFFAVHRWNSWYTEFLYLNDKSKYPLQLVVRSIVLTGENDIGKALGNSEQFLTQSLKYSVIVLSVIPMLIIYPIIQKYLVKGVMLGAVKG